MESNKDLFGSLFGGGDKNRAPEPSTGSVPAERLEQDFETERFPGAAYKKGDFIGQKYEVGGVLGMGGFGVVYLVYSHETKEVYALKTFRDEYLEDAETRERFHKEAQVWVDLERHPYLVRAYWVDEVSGRLYIAMEYIAPDEQGLNSLDGYLQRRPPDLAQSLRWSIQFCHGMEYAYSRGIRSHRDIKPANIMISQDKTVKISDFGLAGIVGVAKAISGVKLNLHQQTVGLSYQTMEGTGFGTPTYMPPEQFTNAAGCDERSDIYSFGIVLYQMATGGQLPFLAPLPEDDSEEEMMRFWRAMRRLHSESPIPKLDSPLFPIIQHCLKKEPGKRYHTLGELRADLEPLLRRETGEVIKPPGLKELEAWEWNNKGNSLANLGHCDEAIRSFDKALKIDPRNADAWINKGASLHDLGRYEEAIQCCDEALEIDPRDAKAWYSKGASFNHLGRYDEAIQCCDRALDIDPGDTGAWINKGQSLHHLGRYDEAIQCCDRALDIDPGNTGAWNNKGPSLDNLGRYDEAIHCYDKALEIDPGDAGAWSNKGNSFNNLGLYDEAIQCYDKALEIDPQCAVVWNNRGLSLGNLGHYDEAIRCYDKALEIDPQFAAAWSNKGLVLHDLGCYAEAISCYDEALKVDRQFAHAWSNKGVSLGDLGRHDEAIQCYDRALEIDPRNAATWYNKALAEDKLGRSQDAAYSFEQFIALAPADEYAKQIEYARERLGELERS